MLTLRRQIFFIKWSITSKVFQGHIRWPFLILFVYGIDWFEVTNTAKLYEIKKTTFDLCKDNISLLDTKMSVRESPKSLGIEIYVSKNANIS